MYIILLAFWEGKRIAATMVMRGVYGGNYKYISCIENNMRRKYICIGKSDINYIWKREVNHYLKKYGLGRVNSSIFVCNWPVI